VVAVVVADLVETGDLVEVGGVRGGVVEERVEKVVGVPGAVTVASRSLKRAAQSGAERLVPPMWSHPPAVTP
jgi:hypothetical protein